VTTKKIFIDGMLGIGDNICQRPFVKTLAKDHEIWIKTATPEIYNGIKNLHFVKTNTTLRTQAIHESITPTFFEEAPKDAERRRIHYGVKDLQTGSVYSTMQKQFKCEPEKLDLPRYRALSLNIVDKKPIALIRPTTERTEWHNASRGPKNEYIDEVARLLSMAGYYVISVAHNEQDKEWITHPTPFSHTKFHRGELNLLQLLSLVEMAEIVVIGPCLIFHAALAYKKKMICLFGGNGGNNHHEKITDDKVTDLSNSLMIYPDNFCFCQQMKHHCDKTISNLIPKVKPFIDKARLSFTKR